MSSTALRPQGRRRGRRAAIAGLAAIAALALMSGTAMADNGSSPSPGTSSGTGAPEIKTFYIGTPTDVDSLNPYSGFLSISYDVYSDVYDLLQGWAQNDYSWT